MEYQLIGLTASGDVDEIFSALDQKQGRVHLQALFAEWLRMDDLVVLTWSGKSVRSGGKTLANLETAVFAAIEALPEPVRLSVVKFAASIAAGSPAGLWRMSEHRQSSTPCATTSLTLAVSPE